MSKSNGICISSSYAFQDMGPVYLFTNENIAGTLKTVGDISGARVLAVGSSGDHAFESFFAGASHVDTFDINSAQKNVIELKNKMIHHLRYDLFMDFFFDQKNFFNQNILQPVIPYCSDDLKLFLKKCADTSNKNFKYLGACTSEYNIKNLQYIANKQNYDSLRDRLPESIPFMHCDIGTLYATMQYNVKKYGAHYLDNPGALQSALRDPDIPPLYANFSAKYDLVLLSNIFDYLYSEAFDKESKLIDMHRNILAPLLANHTNQNARVYFHYMWGANPGAWVNFLQYFQSRTSSPTEFVARTVDAAYYNDKYDVVLYAQRQQR